MSDLVLDLTAVDRTHTAKVGGKGAHLGELMRVDGVQVPAGFCVTTEAFARARGARDSGELIMPSDVAIAIEQALVRHGVHHAYAIRSSATAEDLPTASFAGQHDSFLGVTGVPTVLEHVQRCWASLYGEHAVAYRQRHGIDHQSARMAVVVQHMVRPQSAGVLFTADPISGHRRTSVIEAVAGLGESFVAGTTSADRYTVRDEHVLSRTLVAETAPALTDAQAVALAALGRRIEAHFGSPQDIEWCLVDGEFVIVQSRPITTLFPVPATGDHDHHVYLSVGHQQMMTDAMKTLGISFWQMTTPRPMHVAGGRLFVDVTRMLAVPASRVAFMDMIGRSDPLFFDALQQVLNRGDFIVTVPDVTTGAAPAVAGMSGAEPPPESDPAVVAEMIQRNEASVAELERRIAGMSGMALMDCIREDIQELRRLLFDPESLRVILAAMDASWWLNEHMALWLGEKKAADTLTLSVPGNITSEMGLALLDVADVMRAYPAVVTALERTGTLHALSTVAGGREAQAAMDGWLRRFGMRGVGEIDITRPRWSERPDMLVPLLLSNIHHFPAGAATQRFEEGKHLAETKQLDLLARLRELPDGDQKAQVAKQMIDRMRTFIGYREYPKYGMIRRYFLYKQALVGEAQRLVDAGVLHEVEDIFHLTFEELAEVVHTQRVSRTLLAERRDAHRWHETLTPPRVLTSDGEGIRGSYQREEVPPGALAGLAVSVGVVEGRARVLRDVTQARIEPGDILVTAYTDPSWTSLFVGIRGLVTEVGGLMTHGAVIAREYGLPAVVGVEQATQRIRDGQRIRVHGTDGYVEILDGETRR
ncbi:MAG TPA: rifamycin-inactivating phosphotransferase [Gemmatimonas sp.]|uniref:rifamycin-inactivating phosphotransferase n=1 Tax=Gemmatimonas sp. TaxID=1962908 RepID=UPI002ED8D0C5